MFSLLFLPIGFVVWLLAYGPPPRRTDFADQTMARCDIALLDSATDQQPERSTPLL